MLFNYLKVAFRNQWRSKGFAFINVAGLALGISTCLLITLFVMGEVSYDRFHDKADRIYRLTPVLHFPERDRQAAVSSPPMGPWLSENFAEVEHTVRLTGSSRNISYSETKIHDASLWYADAAFFEVFSFPMIKGNPGTALVEPYSIVLTEKSARRYFGDEDPMGKIMALSDTIPVKVTGVVKNIPHNSHIQFDLLLSLTTISDMRNYAPEEDWFNNNYYTYMLLSPAHELNTLESRLPAVLEKRMAPIKEETGLWYDFAFQPVKDIHLKSHLEAEMSPNGDITYVYIFSIVGIMVLLIACANYINLSTAKSIKRMKELGMRKVIGARRYQLIAQLMAESFLVTLFASAVAFAIFTSLLPTFNTLTGKNLSIEYLYTFDVLLVFLSLIMVVSILAGLYPAFQMSAFSPVRVLKSSTWMSGENAILRKSLVVFQFTISITLIVGTIVIFRQMKYMRNQKLGMNKDQVVQLTLRGDAYAKSKLIKDELLKTPGVVNVSATNFSFSEGIGSTAVLPEGAASNEITSESVIVGDEDFLKTFEIGLVAGRDFSKDMSTDRDQAFLVNETAVKYFGWGTPDGAIGKKINWGLGKEGVVIGVVKDFNFRSLHKEIRPLIIHILPEWFGYMAIKIAATDVSSTVAGLEKKWKQLDIESPFEYSFLDEDFQKLYKAEQQTQLVIGILTSLAILIASLGLFGLTAFTTEQRTKEIGVRKILGASEWRIVKLLSKDFLVLVLLSILIAVPLAGYLANEWLKGFAYRTEVSWWIFAAAAAFSILAALTILSFQSIRAALANPVDSLRSE